jgi:fructokinase
MIVGIGELLWDIFPDGRKVAGGAPFNFAFHCQQLGHDAAVVSRVGDDDLGRELREEVRRLGMSDEFIQTDHDHPTGTVRVTVDAAGHPSYEIREHVAWDHIGWADRLAVLAECAAVVCFGSLAQRANLTRATIRSFATHSRGGRVPAIRVFDANLRPPFIERASLQQNVFESDWVKVNQDELTLLAHLFAMSAKEMIGTFLTIAPGPVACWIVTRGPKGVSVFRSQRRGGEFDEPGPSAEVVDTVGAGDAFTAAMVCLHREGRPLCECARFANSYAARVCEHRGATPQIGRAEVERAAFGSPP